MLPNISLNNKCNNLKKNSTMSTNITHAHSQSVFVSSGMVEETVVFRENHLPLVSQLTLSHIKRFKPRQ